MRKLIRKRRKLVRKRKKIDEGDRQIDRIIDGSINRPVDNQQRSNY